MTALSPLLLLSQRDQEIIALTRRNTASQDFPEVLRAMQDAVERLIPAGRMYHLGDAPMSPIIGSAISGVGITKTSDGVWIVRASLHGGYTALRRL